MRLFEGLSVDAAQVAVGDHAFLVLLEVSLLQPIKYLAVILQRILVVPGFIEEQDVQPLEVVQLAQVFGVELVVRGLDDDPVEIAVQYRVLLYAEIVEQFQLPGIVLLKLGDLDVRDVFDREFTDAYLKVASDLVKGRDLLLPRSGRHAARGRDPRGGYR